MVKWKRGRVLKKKVKKKETRSKTIESDCDIIYKHTHTHTSAREKERGREKETNNQSLCVYTRASKHKREIEWESSRGKRTREGEHNNNKEKCTVCSLMHLLKHIKLQKGWYFYRCNRCHLIYALFKLNAVPVQFWHILFCVSESVVHLDCCCCAVYVCVKCVNGLVFYSIFNFFCILGTSYEIRAEQMHQT